MFELGYLPAPVVSVEDNFDFSLLSYSTHCRFIELLSQSALGQMMFVDKSTYAKCVTTRGIRVFTTKHQIKGRKRTYGGFCDNDGGFTLYTWLTTADDYYEFETKYSKFMPYFNFDKVEIPRVISDDPFTEVLHCFPKTYSCLVVNLKNKLSDIDNILNWVHPKVTHVFLKFIRVFYDTRAEACLTFCNYLMLKLPDVKRFTFELRDIPRPKVCLVQLLQIPKPSTTIRFYYWPGDDSDKTYKDGRWMDTNEI